jgi:glycosyltransferase involved in cell wall biosynthesis
MRRVLTIAYLFPPCGGSGVQRSLKLVRYLPSHGWAPVVLTTRDIAYTSYDNTLMEEVPDIVRVYRSASLAPHRVAWLLSRRHWNAQTTDRVAAPQVSPRGLSLYRRTRDLFFIPDPEVLWLPFAYAAGLRIMRQEKPEVIYSPTNPASGAALAMALSQATGVPYVLDYRDLWTNLPAGWFTQQPPTCLHKAVQVWLERQCAMRASAIVMIGQRLVDDILGRMPEFLGKTSVIPNGFDPADLASAPPQPRPADRIRLVYTGEVQASYDTNLRTLVSALALLRPDLRERFEVVIVGRTYPEAQEMVSGIIGPKAITFAGYVSHATAVGYLKSADAALLFIPQGDESSITGKVFEYIGSGHPIIALIEPGGDAAAVLRQAKRDQYICAPQDVSTLTTMLERIASEGVAIAPPESVRDFDRREQAGLFAHIFDRVAAERHGSDRFRPTDVEL